MNIEYMVFVIHPGYVMYRADIPYSFSSSVPYSEDRDYSAVIMYLIDAFQPKDFEIIEA